MTTPPSPDEGFTMCRSKNARKPRYVAPSIENISVGIGYQSYIKPTNVVIKCSAHNVSPSKRFARGGIIPMVESDGVRYYCMAIDNVYGNTTDFGGGIKRHENWITAAARELKEESHGLFDFTSPESITTIYTTGVVVHDDVNTIILTVKLQCDDYKKLIDDYRKIMIETENDNENSRIVWAPESIFLYLLRPGSQVEKDGTVLFPTMYERIRELLAPVDGFYTPLHKTEK